MIHIVLKVAGWFFIILGISKLLKALYLYILLKKGE